MKKNDGKKKSKKKLSWKRNKKLNKKRTVYLRKMTKRKSNRIISWKYLKILTDKWMQAAKVEMAQQMVKVYLRLRNMIKIWSRLKKVELKVLEAKKRKKAPSVNAKRINIVRMQVNKLRKSLKLRHLQEWLSSSFFLTLYS